jgi:quercetin dioxygenase-like cupin family protein
MNGMECGRRARSRLGAIVWSAMALATMETASAQVPGGCNTPASQRTSEIGCYLSGSEDLGSLPREVWWHLYQYPRRAAAEAEKGPQGTVIESFGKVWLYTIAEAGWRPSGGERVAVIGPLLTTTGIRYTARYMEAAFPPGMHTSVHHHPGPEAWYVIAGTQCLETPAGTIMARAGEGAVVPEGPPMRLSSVGDEMRRSVLLVLHDASHPWIHPATGWEPKGACPK